MAHAEQANAWGHVCIASRPARRERVEERECQVSILVDLQHLRLQFTRVSKAFGSSQVLIDLDLDIMPGEKVTLIGPTGSGKTTVLRLAMTLEKPTSATYGCLRKHHP